jgi:hypothetical protein
MSRYRAFASHLVLSAAVGFALLALTWFVWYPAPMLTAIGGHQIFFLIVGIDVIVGPLLTLVVFKPGKRSLVFDVLVIVTLQIGALIYGVSALLEARPVYIAALGEKFQVIQAPEMSRMHFTNPDHTLPWFGPKVVGVRVPADKKARGEASSALEMGVGAGHFQKFHVSYADIAKEVASKASPIAKLKAHNPKDHAAIDAWLANRGLSEAEVVFQPVQISTTDYAMILARDSGSVIGIAPFRPWP